MRCHADEPAISLALSSTHLDVCLQLLMWRIRKGSGPPLVFKPRQLHQIVFDVWSREGVGATAPINTAHFCRLFTVFILCTQPPEVDVPEDGSGSIARAADESPDADLVASTSDGASTSAIAPRAVPDPTARIRKLGLSDDEAASRDSEGRGAPGAGALTAAKSLDAMLPDGGEAAEKGAPSPARRAALPPTLFPVSAPGTLPPPPQMVLVPSDSFIVDESTSGCAGANAALRRSVMQSPGDATLQHPQNPVLLALQLASKCHTYSKMKKRDMVIAERLDHAATLFEHLASGLLHCAARAAVQAEEQKQYNPWRMGARQVHPDVARDLFVCEECIEHAAEHQLKIFIAHPIVYMHLHEIFWPTGPSANPLLADVGHVMPTTPSSHPGTGIGQRAGSPSTPHPPMLSRLSTSGVDLFALTKSDNFARVLLRWVGMLLANVAVLPLLPFLPIALEHDLEEHFRGKVERAELPFGIIWILPAGRFFLWCLSAYMLAVLVTYLPPVEGEGSGERVQLGAAAEGREVSFGVPDIVLLLYAAGWAHMEHAELRYDLRRYGARGGVRKYLRDPFNFLDLCLIFLLVLLVAVRAMGAILPVEIVASEATDGADTHETLLAAAETVRHVVISWQVPSQALLALVCWLRILQVLFIFSSTGPLLLMAIRMLQDLAQFLTLATFVVVAFGCAFFVLFRAAPGPYAHRVASVSAVISLLVQGTLNGESDYVLSTTHAAQEATPFAWALMFLFGVVVVLLLLNLLIARFAKTFDMVYENVDANFKVAFACVVIEAYKKELLPPPLNLLRFFILRCYALVHDGQRLPCPCPRQGAARLVATFAPEHAKRMFPDGDLGWHHAYHALGISPTRRSSKEAGSVDDNTGGDADMEGEAEIAREVAAFLRKATDSQVALLPEGVEAYVLDHQHDVAREERWRTMLQKEISSVEQRLQQLSATLLKDDRQRGSVHAVSNIRLGRAAAMYRRERERERRAAIAGSPPSASATTPADTNSASSGAPADSLLGQAAASAMNVAPVVPAPAAATHTEGEAADVVADLEVASLSATRRARRSRGSVELPLPGAGRSLSEPRSLVGAESAAAVADADGDDDDGLAAESSPLQLYQLEETMLKMHSSLIRIEERSARDEPSRILALEQQVAALTSQLEQQQPRQAHPPLSETSLDELSAISLPTQTEMQALHSLHDRGSL